MITVVVADDHPVFRTGLRQMLGAVPDIEVVGEAANGTDALAVAAETSPDVVVMDLRMPGLDGISATRRLMARPAPPAVVVLTMYEDDDSVFAAMRAGALGYVLKGAEQDEIVRAIQAVAAGEAIFGPDVARRVVAHFAQADSRSTPGFPTLTSREREVLHLIADGRGNATIGRDLGISLKTVRNNVSNILTKLQVSDRSAAIVRARDAGFGRASGSA